MWRSRRAPTVRARLLTSVVLKWWCIDSVVSRHPKSRSKVGSVGGKTRRFLVRGDSFGFLSSRLVEW